MPTKYSAHDPSLSARRALQEATSFLFAPGDRPDRFAKALASEADIVIIDWEASVIPERKALARQATVDYFRAVSRETNIAIRVSGSAGPCPHARASEA